MQRIHFIRLLTLAFPTCVACSSPQPTPPQPAASPNVAPPTQTQPTALKPPPQQASKPTPVSGDVPSPCPNGMVYVESSFCPKYRDTCLEKGQYNRPPKHPTICKTFAPERTCLEPLRRQRFCIDTYEFPNKKGAHPPSMISAWDSAALCHAEGKRLCWNSEWVMACEGSKQTHFPYGSTRDSTKCNQDREHIRPVYKNMDPRDPDLRDRELTKLDESVPSGSRDGCKSDFGVHDMVGNFDEWVLIPHPKGQSRWAATKGGWWGRLRNACRPWGVGHPESFVFFPVSTRCCADPDTNALPATPEDIEKLPLWTPPKSTKRGKLEDALRKAWVPPSHRAHNPPKTR